MDHYRETAWELDAARAWGNSASTGNRARQGSPAPMTAPLGGGKARPAGPTVHPMERAIQDIQTPEQYEALMQGLRRR